MERRQAFWTYDEQAFKEHGYHLYYFAPANRTKSPYRKQIHVDAILDIADDGTLAGVELVSGPLPPPPASEELGADVLRGNGSASTNWTKPARPKFLCR